MRRSLKNNTWPYVLKTLGIARPKKGSDAYKLVKEIVQAIKDARAKYKKLFTDEVAILISEARKALNTKKKDDRFESVARDAKTPHFVFTPTEEKTAFSKTIVESHYKINFTPKLRKKLNDVKDGSGIETTLNMFETMMREAVNNHIERYGGIRSDTKLQFAIRFSNDDWISTNKKQTFGEADEAITSFLQRIIATLQSNKERQLDENTVLIIKHFTPILGGAYHHITREADISGKSSVITIKNKDNLCLVRCVVCSTSYAERKEWKRDKTKNTRNRETAQKKAAVALCNEMNMDITSMKGIEDLKKIENHLQMRIMVYNYDKNIIYHGNKLYDCPGVKDKIYIVYHSEHYDLISRERVNAFLSLRKYCHHCQVGYSKTHTCSNDLVCNYCKSDKCSQEKGNFVHCSGCGYNFPSEKCKELHICPNNVCSKCKMRSYKGHKCGYKKCGNCKKLIQISLFGDETHHDCAIQKLEKDPETKLLQENQIIFFDFETTQDTGKHIVNYYCAMDGTGKRLASGKTIASFVETFIRKEYAGCTFIAHNGSGYDFMFVLNEMYNSKISDLHKVSTIYAGGRIMTMMYKPLKIRFIDSYKFVAAPLDSFSKSFNVECLKGFFPYRFNTPENAEYYGEIPSKEVFDVKPQRKEEFDAWYEERSKTPYHFAEELEKYCWDDVKLLQKGMMAFRNEALELTGGVDPFSCVTIAGFTMKVFRTNHMKENSICVLPNRTSYLNSKTCHEWLCSIEKEKGISIIREFKINLGDRKCKSKNPLEIALSGGYDKQKYYRADGFYDAEGVPTIYEFNGCYWHGCKKCHPRGFNKQTNMSFSELRRLTAMKKKILEKKGFKVVTMWECAWNAVKPENISEIVGEYVSPMEPRDSLYGGRTEVFKAYKKWEQTDIKHGKYDDVVSLYPSVQKACEYPVGSPDCISHSFACSLADGYITQEDIHEHVRKIYGIIKCKVIPPKGLFHPVLPSHIDGKLKFSLCGKCNSKTKCKHSDDERALVGTWVSLEVQKAIEMGYRVTDVYEAWHWSQKGDLFGSFVDKFFAVKNKYKKTNPVKSKVAKLLINSLWGKFGQRDDMLQTKVVTKYEDFEGIVCGSDVQKLNWDVVSDEVVEVHYNRKKTHVENSFTTNPVVAAFVTCHARLKLYNEALQPLGKRAMYCDTDSVIYEHVIAEGNGPVNQGLGLGQWESELVEGEVMTEFVGMAPKSYGYKTNMGKKILHMKGISLGYKDNAVRFNMENMKRLIDRDIEKLSTPAFNQFVRDKKQKNIFNRTMVKQVSFAFDKRMLAGDYQTRPFGYY